ncbi:MAG: VacB/RNase II family 3'-5' exoribonuclease, partial [Planctomycetota bacterium]
VRPGESGDGDSVEDLFVPPGQTRGALEGDIVEIKVAPGRRGRSEAQVARIVQRARRQFTGTYQSVGGRPAVYLDGTPHDEPVFIGDIQGLPLEKDDKVFVEVVRFPGPNEDGGSTKESEGEAVLLERLGSSSNPNIDTLTIMRQYGLPDQFPEDVIAEARLRSDEFNELSKHSGRRDLTEKLTLTIDPFDARDFDDAISLERESNGHWRLWVHVADVGYFIHPGGKLDQEARRRGNSVYLPDRVIPMVPEIISNRLASLQPEKNRLAKTVELEFSDDGTLVHTAVHASVIRSDVRLHYDLVDQFLAKPETFTDRFGNDVCELLLRMHELAMMIRRRRLRGGAITMEMPEVKLDFDRGGKVKGARKTKNTESHQIIEEFMLQANQAVAAWLDDSGYRFLHRVHPSPDRRKLRQLSTFIRDLKIGIDSVESRFEIQSVIDRVAGTPLEDAVNFAVLRSMSKAIYSPQADGHYALDMAHYCHFTSPIRRYPDLTVHRLIDRIQQNTSAEANSTKYGIRGETVTPDESNAVLVNLGYHCSDCERNAAAAERELTLLKLLHFLKKHIGQTMPAIVSRVFADGFLAKCTKLPVDGYVSIDQLSGDQWRFEKRGQMLVGFKAHNRYRLGDQLTVRVARVDLIQRQLFLDPIKNHSVGNSKPGVRRTRDSGKSAGYAGKRKKDRRQKAKRRRR